MFQNYVQYIVLKKNNQFIQNLILISKLKINQQSIKVMGSRQNHLKGKYMLNETAKTEAPYQNQRPLPAKRPKAPNMGVHLADF